MQIEVGNTKRVWIKVDADMQEFISSKRWYVGSNLVVREHPNGRVLARLLYEKKTEKPLGCCVAITFIDGDVLNHTVSNLRETNGRTKSPKTDQQEEAIADSIPEGIVLLKKQSETDRQKYQAAIKVGGVMRYVGKTSTSLKKAMREHDRYVEEHGLDLPRLLPQEKTTRRYEYEPGEGMRLCSNVVPA